MQWNIERKWMQDKTSENKESFRNLRCGVRKCHSLATDLKEVWARKLEKLKKQRKLRRFAGFVHDVMPAGCGLDFKGISSPQSTAITARNTNS